MKALDQYHHYLLELKHTIDLLPVAGIEATVEQIQRARVNRKQVFIMGNGGSAATASHFACDLGKNTVSAGLPRLRVQSLTDNMAFFSACANDYGYETVFAEQLANFLQPADVVIAISASGNSANVLKAVQMARVTGAYTIGWSGYQGGKLAKLVDLSLVVPSDSIEQIEDMHLIVAHMVTIALRNAGQNGFIRNGSQNGQYHTLLPN